MTAESRPPTRVLIVNQHGDNRGDEAALEGMITALAERLGGCEFTIVHQYRSKQPRVPLDPPVEWLPMRMSLLEALRLSAYSLLRRAGLKWASSAGVLGRRIAAAYESADIVVSAPGGPYFGDLYAKHEIVHWFYVWLAGVHGKRIVLYSASAGPFEARVLNPVRRRLYHRFYLPLTARESASVRHLESLLGSDLPVALTADSAFQLRVPPADRVAFEEANRSRSGKLIVALAAINFTYPGESQQHLARARHDAAISRALEVVNEHHPTHVLLFPQLYGPRKSDLGYLEHLARRFAPDVTWELVDPALGSRDQRSLVGRADVCVAGRYHPLVFATSAAVPALTIHYEHKALGLARDVGLERYAFDIRDLGRGEVDGEALGLALRELVGERDELSKQIRERERELRSRALKVNDIVVEALESSRAAQRQRVG